MFHAIGEGDAIAGADPHYSFSVDNYCDFLNKIGQCTSIASSLNEVDNKPILTFDDGHVSNYLAAEILANEYASSADFFINPNNVGDSHFLTWSQIVEMSDLGMSIQSHSLDHVYLSDLSYEQQKLQLEQSKKTIEDNIGKEVTVLAPPGGRYNEATIELCRKLGYQHISVSRPGLWLGEYCSPRIPVLRTTAVESLATCNGKLNVHLAKTIAKYTVTGVAKKALGNGFYDIVRARILGAST